jgi:hypothetical protein
VKATEYVERSHRSSFAGAVQGGGRQPFYHQYYVVAETCSGRTLVTEITEGGRAMVELGEEGITWRAMSSGTSEQ